MSTSHLWEQITSIVCGRFSVRHRYADNTETLKLPTSSPPLGPSHPAVQWPAVLRSVFTPGSFCAQSHSLLLKSEVESTSLVPRRELCYQPAKPYRGEGARVQGLLCCHAAFRLKLGVLLGPAGSWGLSGVGGGLPLPGAQLQTYVQVCDRKAWSLGGGDCSVALRRGKIFGKYRGCAGVGLSLQEKECGPRRGV